MMSERRARSCAADYFDNHGSPLHILAHTGRVTKGITDEALLHMKFVCGDRMPKEVLDEAVDFVTYCQDAESRI